MKIRRFLPGGRAMRNLRFMLAAALLAAIWTGAAVADQNQAQNPNRPPIGTNPNPVGGPVPNHPQMGNNPNPVGWGGQSDKPTPPAKPVAPPPTQPADNGNRNGSPQGTVGNGLGGTYIYDPYYGGYRFYPNGSMILYPPVYMSPNQFYGSQSTLRYGGLGDQSGFGSSTRRDDEPAEPKKSDRGANSQSNAQAWKYIGYGDARFVEQKYSEANERYRTAARTAPQLADALFRQGFALLAMGRYEPALTAIKRGMKLDPNWANSDFELKTLYGDDEAGKKDAHREAIATALEKNPNDPDLLFLLGVHLYFDGQAERAAKFFQHAQKIAGDDADYMKGFLAKQ
jgi:hypothetical protein